MGDIISVEERAYWEKEARHRLNDVEEPRVRRDPAYLIAAAELRLKEADERLTDMKKAEEALPKKPGRNIS